MLTVALKMVQKLRVCLPFTAVRSMVSCKLYTPCREQSAAANAQQTSEVLRCSLCLHGSILYIQAWSHCRFQCCWCADFPKLFRHTSSANLQVPFQDIHCATSQDWEGWGRVGNDYLRSKVWKQKGNRARLSSRASQGSTTQSYTQ